ncbi:MAG: leucyl aminopeptidase [Isosphaeraceae bacterium]|nr:leucyl aminopeptidase [Isosphaeraceae bacterium]
MNMKPTISTAAPLSLDVDRLAIGVRELDAAGSDPAAMGAASALAELVAAQFVNTAPGEVTAVLGSVGAQARAVLAFGLGKPGAFDAGAAFSAGVALSKRLGAKPHKPSAAVVVPEVDEPVVRAFLEGLFVGTRGPDLRKSEPSRVAPESLVLITTPEREQMVARALERAEIVGSAVNFARDLANTPPAEKPPARIAAIVGERLSGAGVEVEIWGRPEIESARFGGLLGVAAGSDEPPAFVQLRYRKGGDRPTVALVGKGVTFDSGGLSLKPSASMEDMKSDMTGAAVVAATILAVARLGLPVNVHGYLAFTENMTGGKAMKLGDVLTMRNGKTVEVMNTDAEGRLILADALSYAAESEPARILDLATLTGACLVALGSKVAGLFANDDAFAADLAAAAARAGERVWRMPLDDDYFEAMKSPVADFKNVGGKWAGAITAAKFLQQFVADRPWLHLDIAGPSWADSDSPTRDAGGTGCFVRTLVDLLAAGQV